jgi:hypothetical protein
LARLESTAVFNADATLAPEDLSITPSETTDSGVLNAPTLADDGELHVEEPAARPSSSSVSQVTAAKSKSLTTVRESRFTTVEEAERLAREQQSHRWAMAVQLVLLVATLAGIGYIGWRLTRPAAADDLYATIAEQVENEGVEELNPVADEVTEFMKRFPHDPRAEEIRSYAKELELQKLQRQLRMQSRLRGGVDAHPVADVFAEAVKLRDANPSAAAAMLESLLALYPKEAAASSGLTDEQRAYLTLAERELAELRSALEKQAAQQLPLLRKRLLAAEKMEATAPEAAARIYGALVRLYGGHSWASPVVDQARARLDVLQSK